MINKKLFFFALLFHSLLFSQEQSQWLLNPPKDDFSVIGLAREDSKIEAFVKSFAVLVKNLGEREEQWEKNPAMKKAMLAKKIALAKIKKDKFKFGDIVVSNEDQSTTSIMVVKNENSISIRYSNNTWNEKIEITRNGLREKDLYQTVKSSGVEMTHVFSTEREEEKHYVLLVLRP